MKTSLIITSARGTKAQQSHGIRYGADTCFVKPVDLEERLLHVTNLVRMVKQPQTGGTATGRNRLRSGICLYCQRHRHGNLDPTGTHFL